MGTENMNIEFFNYKEEWSYGFLTWKEVQLDIITVSELSMFQQKNIVYFLKCVVPMSYIWIHKIIMQLQHEVEKNCLGKQRELMGKGRKG